MDALDKLAFSFPSMVRALLRLLPEALTAELDPRTLHRLPAAHVGPGLRRRHADMPWRIACRPTAGRPPRPPVLLAIEFQATVDRYMALPGDRGRHGGRARPFFFRRIAGRPAFAVREPSEDVRVPGRRQEVNHPRKDESGHRWEATTPKVHPRSRGEHDALDARELSPPVLPVVLYNGAARWRAAVEVGELIAPVGPELAPYQPSQRYLLVDEWRKGAEDLPGRNLMAAVSGLEQSRGPGDLVRVVERLGEPQQQAQLVEVQVHPVEQPRPAAGERGLGQALQARPRGGLNPVPEQHCSLIVASASQKKMEFSWPAPEAEARQSRSDGKRGQREGGSKHPPRRHGGGRFGNRPRPAGLRDTRGGPASVVVLDA